MNTWANYSSTIYTEYHDVWVATDGQLRRGQLEYQASINVYLTEFCTLNVYGLITGEDLQKKINIAMPDSILDM
jgi:hypothetical protein